MIAFLKQKAMSETPKPRIPYMNPKDMQVGVMNPIQYEKGIIFGVFISFLIVYCDSCHDEDSFCPKCGCHVNIYLVFLYLDMSF